MVNKSPEFPPRCGDLVVHSSDGAIFHFLVVVLTRMSSVFRNTINTGIYTSELLLARDTLYVIETGDTGFHFLSYQPPESYTRNHGS